MYVDMRHIMAIALSSQWGFIAIFSAFLLIIAGQSCSNWRAEKFNVIRNVATDVHRSFFFYIIPMNVSKVENFLGETAF